MHAARLSFLMGWYLKFAAPFLSTTSVFILESRAMMNRPPPFALRSLDRVLLQAARIPFCTLTFRPVYAISKICCTFSSAVISALSLWCTFLLVLQKQAFSSNLFLALNRKSLIFCSKRVFLNNLFKPLVFTRLALEWCFFFFTARRA